MTHLLSLLAGDAAEGPPLLFTLAPLLLFVSPVLSVFSEDPLKNFLIADVIFSLDLEDILSVERKSIEIVL